MKELTTKLYAPVGLIMMLLVCAAGIASGQSRMDTLYVQTETFDQHKKPAVVPLSKVLEEIERTHHIRFLYQSDLIEGKTVSKVVLTSANLARKLGKLLVNDGLTYEKQGNSTYIIKRLAGFQTRRPAPAAQITGTVTDASTGNTLPGVNILVKGTSTGTSTGSDGTFELTVESLQDTLVVSFIGYQTREVPIQGRTEISIEMQSQAITGEEMVVVGYGTQEKTDVTGSVTSISTKSLKEAPVTNVSNSLAGKLSGVAIMNDSGEPGRGGGKIRIRGDHSLNNNAPLVVIDGVPDRSGRFNHMDPNDIKSVNVLKDATAAIYGAQAANGVILVETRTGSKNQTPEVSVNINQGFHQPTRIPNMADAPTYMRMVNEINKFQQGIPPTYAQEDIQAYSKPNRDPWLYPNTDWFNELIKPVSLQTKGDISVEGGTSHLSYFLSAGGQTKNGNYRRSATDYNQINFRSNIQNQVARSLNVTFNLSGRWEDRNYPAFSTRNLFVSTMQAPPNKPAFYPSGQPGLGVGRGQNPVVASTNQTGYNKDQRYILASSLALNLTIPGFKGFNVKGRVSYNKEFQDVKDWTHPWTLYSFDKQTYKNKGGDPTQYLSGSPKGPSDPQLTREFYQQYTLLGNLVANYKQNFGDHNVKLMLGTERESFKSSNFNAFRRHFISNKIDQLFAGGQKDWSNGGSAAHGARQNYFGRANYNYQSKYLFEFVGRYDGSYLFPEDSRYGFFPAFSAGWRLTEEPFFRDNVGFFDELKLRASWGLSGNDILNPGALVEARQYLESYQFGGGYVFGDNLNKSIYRANTANPAITWETSSKFNIGVDGAILDNRLSFTINYFNELREDILIKRNASVPQSTGLSLPRENLGKVRSWGYDGSVSWDHSVNGDFSYNMELNLGHFMNKIAFWDETPGKPSYQRSTGRTINAGLYYKTMGVFQDQEEVENYPHWAGARPGDLIFKDVNGDGKITADDRVRINKNHTPNWTGGITLGASYKGFDLSVLFQGAVGAVQYLSTQSGSVGNYLAAYAAKRWRPDPDAQNDLNGMKPDPSGTPYSGPRVYDRGDPYWSPLSSNNNTYFLRSTDYLRLKNAVIGYSLPADLLTQWGIQQLRIYANGFNLLTWDKFKVMDPEASNATGGYYPQIKTVNLGISLTF